MSSTEEKIKVMQAFINGETIEYRCARTGYIWNTIYPNEPRWDFLSSEYRVKPKPIECWVNIYQENGQLKGLTYHSKHTAKKNSSESAVRIAVHMQEVIEDK